MKSEHFLLKTDQPVEQSKVILVALEVLHAALLVGMQAESDPPLPPIEVVLFDRHEDFWAISNRPGVGGFTTRQLPGDVEPSPIIVTHGKLSLGTRSRLVHELVHQVLHRRTGHLPWWLDEGLAGYFSTLWVSDPERGAAVVGEPPRDVDFDESAEAWIDPERRTAKLWIPRKEAPALTALFAASRATVSAEKMPAHYAASWKLMHVLAGHRNAKYTPRFWNMLSRLSDGATGQEAFEKAYEGVPMAEISAAYDEMLLDHGESALPLSFFPPADPKIEERGMGDGEVHALWARILSGRPTAERSAEVELFAGEHDDPTSVPFRYARASILLQTEGSATVGEDVYSLLREEPDNPRYLLLTLLEARRVLRAEKDAGRKARKQAEVRKLAEELHAKAQTAAQQSLTGAVFGEIGEMQKAVEMVERSTKTDPACGSCYSIRAQIELAAGLLNGAEESAVRAIRLTPDEASVSALREVLSRVEALRRKHAGQPDTPGPEAPSPAGSASP